MSRMRCPVNHSFAGLGVTPHSLCSIADNGSTSQRCVPQSSASARLQRVFEERLMTSTRHRVSADLTNCSSKVLPLNSLDPHRRPRGRDNLSRGLIKHDNGPPNRSGGIRLRHQDSQHEPLGIHYDMALTTLNLLTAIKTVDRPLFSVVLTDWESAMAILESVSRPRSSRSSPRNSS